MPRYGDVICSEIRLTEPGDVPNQVQVLRVGSFQHPKYGEFEITRAILAEMKLNADNRVRGIDIAFDYFHLSDESASGWPKLFELKEGGTELWATVDWTPRARKMLAEREVRYFSPDFAFEWTDPESGKKYYNVLFGGGLTNRPFVKEMAAIVADETERETMTEKEILELKAQNMKLAEEAKQYGEDKAKLQEMDAAKAKEVETLKAQIAELQAKLKALEGAAANAEAAKQLAEKETAFTVLLSEGKACAAQKEAFLKGDMAGFIANASKVNLNPAGSGANAGGDADKDAKIIKLAEEIEKRKPGISRGDALSQAIKESK
jgi:DNA repair exonuclease SbcCD ATPase subunit